MFAMLKQMHGALIGGNEQDMKLLTQNKYYVMPTLDNDKLIEDA